MRRNFLLLVAALIFTISSFFFWRAPRDSFEPSALSEAASAVRAGSPSALSFSFPRLFQAAIPAATVALTKALRTERGGELFTALFPASRLHAIPESDLAAAAAARFEEPYPAALSPHHAGARDHETVARLGILKALAHKKGRKELPAFYTRVARDPREPLVVRRQALRNLFPTFATAPESVREHALENLPPRLVALAGFTEKELLERHWGHLGSLRKLSQSDQEMFNKWEVLPCPTAAEFVSLSQPLNWQGTEEYVCDLSPLGKFGRALKLLARLELPGGTSAIEQNLRLPYEFVKNRSRKMSFNFNQSDTVAVNRQGAIEIGGIFFTYAPLTALEVLIHEARHTDEEDMGHTICLQGDIPRTGGGCDQRLTEARDAGAYSYGTYFALALSEMAGLSEADREFLRAEALSNVLRRFNELEADLANFQDAVATLNEQGKLEILHPFAGRAMAPAGVPAGERFTRISYDDKSGGLFLFKKDRSARTWSWGEAPADFRPLQVPTDLAMLRAGKGRLPFQEYAYTLFLDGAGAVRFVDFDTRENKHRLYEYPLKPEFAVKDFALGALQFTYFLSEEGKLFRVRRWGNEKPFPPVFEAGPAFADLTGGTLRDALYLTGADGALYRQRLVERYPQEGEDGWSNSDSVEPELIPELDRVDLKIPVPLRAYREGFGLRAALGQDSSLWIKPYGDHTAPTQLRSAREGTKGFALLKLVELHGRLKRARLATATEKFARACGLHSVVADPWFQRGVGLRDGQLVFEGDEGACWPAALPEVASLAVAGKIRAFTFRAGEQAEFVRGTLARPDAFFSPVGLELTMEDGSVRLIRPYVQ